MMKIGGKLLYSEPEAARELGITCALLRILPIPRALPSNVTRYYAPSAINKAKKDGVVAAYREKCALVETPSVQPSRRVIAYKPSEGECVVYALVDPRDPEVLRYVGRSTNPRGRYETHCKVAASLKVSEWVESLRADGLWPMMLELESCNEEDASAREIHWITECRKRGEADLNVLLVRQVGESDAA